MRSETTKQWIVRFAATAGLTIAFQARARADSVLERPGGISGIGDEPGLQILIFVFCVGIAAVVFAAMIWSIFQHRKSLQEEPARFPYSARVEIAWTVIPIAILIAMTLPAAGTLLRWEDASDSDFSIKAVGYQWKWEYEYLDDGFRFASHPAQGGQRPAGGEEYSGVDRPLVVPVGAKVRMLLTSNDVIHSWWVPALGRNRNAIPGHVSEFWFRAEKPGTFNGRCAEWCGPGQPCMPIVVTVLPAEEYGGWLAANASAEPEAAILAEVPAAASDAAALDKVLAQGRALHAGNCAACHQETGQGLPAAGFPPLAGTKVSKEEHIRVAMHGRPGTAMAAFGPRLADEELAAIVTYQRNAWGNDTGDLVAPADVAAAR